jgi:hypothetical protein
MRTRLTKNFINTIHQHVNVVGSFDLLSVDRDFDILKEYLLSKKKDVFDHKDFFLASHYDPEYYLPKCPYGLSTFNLIRTFQEVDISLSRLIFVSNRTGYLEDFKALIPKEMHKWELPVVIDDCLSAFQNNFLSNFNWDSVPINAGDIKMNGISMIGKGRVHRNAIYNHLVDNQLLNNIAVSYNSSKKYDGVSDASFTHFDKR